MTNPRFEDMEKWWDVLCNVATGTIRYASHLPLATAAEPYVAVDNDFIADVRLSLVAFELSGGSARRAKPHRTAGKAWRLAAQVVAAIQAHLSEDRIRAMFQDYVQTVVDIAFDEAEFPDEATKRKVRRAASSVPPLRCAHCVTARAATGSTANTRRRRTDAGGQRATVRDVATPERRPAAAAHGFLC